MNHSQGAYRKPYVKLLSYLLHADVHLTIVTTHAITFTHGVGSKRICGTGGHEYQNMSGEGDYAPLESANTTSMSDIIDRDLWWRE